MLGTLFNVGVAPTQLLFLIPREHVGAKEPSRLGAQPDELEVEEPQGEHVVELGKWEQDHHRHEHCEKYRAPHSGDVFCHPGLRLRQLDENEDSHSDGVEHESVVDCEDSHEPAIVVFADALVQEGAMMVEVLHTFVASLAVFAIFTIVIAHAAVLLQYNVSLSGFAARS